MLKRIAVLISGGGTNLQALIDAQHSGAISSGEIVGVVSSSEQAYGLQRAKDNNIPAFVVSRKETGSPEGFTEKMIDTLNALQPDLIVLAGFMCILSPSFIKAFDGKIINIHPSLVPSFCGDGYYGLKVHEKALEYGVKVTGATVHFVNEIVDGGAIVLQKSVEVMDGDTPEVLQRRVMEQAEWNILPRAVELFCGEKLMVEGRIVRIKE